MRAAVVVVMLGSLGLAGGCAHTVKIDSSPPGATISVDGEVKGKAPVTLEEEFGLFEEKKIRVELEGYAPLETTIMQTEPVWPIVIPAVCGAPFTLGASCFALRYATSYAEAYEYRLSPLGADGEVPPEAAEDGKDLDPDATYPF